jgi:hypothetical protein
MMIALITIFLKGGFTLKMLEILGIQKDVDPGPYVEKVPPAPPPLSSITPPHPHLSPQLKKQAKPYRFLLWEQQYIYPIVIKGYDQLRANGMDVSSEGGRCPPPALPLSPLQGPLTLATPTTAMAATMRATKVSSHHLSPLPSPLTLSTEAAAAHEQLTHKADDDDDDIQDGVQLARGYANSSGHVAPSTLVHSAEKDSLW